MLTLDARVDPPTHAITLTTRDPDQPPETYRHASHMVWKRLRRHYGRVDYFGFIEHTTGLARLSGGLRRMHGHYLVKFRDYSGAESGSGGLCDPPGHGSGEVARLGGSGPGPDVLEVERLVRETWQSVTGAYVVEVAQLVTPGAAMAYLSLHHQKPQQAPPAGWRGMRSRPSKGYFSRPMWQLRQQARQELAIEAIAWASGITDVEAALVYHFSGVHIEEEA